MNALTDIHGVIAGSFDEPSELDIEQQMQASAAPAGQQTTVLSMLQTVRESIVNNRCDGDTQYALGVRHANENMLERIDYLIAQQTGTPAAAVPGSGQGSAAK